MKKVNKLTLEYLSLCVLLSQTLVVAGEDIGLFVNELLGNFAIKKKVVCQEVSGLAFAKSVRSTSAQLFQRGRERQYNQQEI